MRNFMAAMESFLKGMGYFKDWYVFQRLRRHPKVEMVLFSVVVILLMIAFFGICFYYMKDIIPL